jgi:hypothetical protein
VIKRPQVACKIQRHATQAESITLAAEFVKAVVELTIATANRSRMHWC